MSSSRPVWILMDASNHIYRDFHASADTCLDLTEARIEMLLDRIECDRFAVCFDSPSSFRKRIDPTYKSNRSIRPATVAVALAKLRQYCFDLEIDVVECDGYEADDCIATLSAVGCEAGCRVIMVSSDKDLRQCLRPGLVTQLTECKRDRDRLFTRYMTAAQLHEDYGVTPEQWCDYQCLVGDSTDGIKGAEGIGPQAARQILARCGSLAEYYENPWPANLTAKQMAKMQTFRSRWKTVEQLVRLRVDAPIPEAWREVDV